MKWNVFHFDADSLVYTNATYRLIKTFVLAILCTIIVSSAVTYVLLKWSIDPARISTEQKLVVIHDYNAHFIPTEFREYLYKLNVKFPDVVFAQSQLETGNFTSKLFKENNNCFGMKESTMRASTSQGTEGGYCAYDSWRESAIDYALFQCRYLGNIKTEEEYLSYLSQSYAENPNYIQQIKALLK